MAIKWLEEVDSERKKVFYKHTPVEVRDGDWLDEMNSGLYDTLDDFYYDNHGYYLCLDKDTAQAFAIPNGHIK